MHICMWLRTTSEYITSCLPMELAGIFARPMFVANLHGFNLHHILKSPKSTISPDFQLWFRKIVILWCICSDIFPSSLSQGAPILQSFQQTPPSKKATTGIWVVHQSPFVLFTPIFLGYNVNTIVGLFRGFLSGNSGSNEDWGWNTLT